jgi:hypothetical protein
MKRMAVVAFVSLVAASVLAAAPARRLYEPPEPPKQFETITLAGTYWFGTCYVPNFWIIFEPNRTITYGYNGNKWNSGSWKLEGNNLYFEMNKRYLEFRGTVTGNSIQGEAWNVQGSRWKTSFTKTTPK